MSFIIQLKRLSTLVCRTATCYVAENVHIPTQFGALVVSKPASSGVINSAFRASLPRMFSSGSDYQDDDKITTDQMMDMLEHDSELQSMLKDIIKDFDPNPPPPEPPKLRQQSDIETDSQHKPHYQEHESESRKVPMSLLQRYKHYRDEDSEVILDADEEQEQFYLYQEKKDRFSGQDMKRGKEGVFDLPELVKILQDENVVDLAVVQVPDEIHYANYMVLCSAKSPRHSKSVLEYLRKLNKLKKNAKDPFIIPDRNPSCDWKVLDLGNIVLHLFLPNARERYDLETLWTVGEKYDDLCNQPEDPFYDTLEEEMKFLEAAQIRTQ